MPADLLIHCATAKEMAFFLKRFVPRAEERLANGAHLLKGLIHKVKYHLLISGPGVFNTICAITAFLEKQKPDLILQTGICGVFGQTGGRIGDVIVATGDQYIHTGIKSDKSRMAPLPFDLLPDVPGTQKGIYLFEPHLVNRSIRVLENRKFRDKKTKIRNGKCITVSSITGSKTIADKRYASFEPVMEAMEGAAAAHAASLYGVPILEIRSVSNFVGDRDKSGWDIGAAGRQISVICECASLLIAHSSQLIAHSS